MTADLQAQARLVQQLVPVGCRLVGAVRDRDADDVAHVLATVPDGRLDALLVVVAAMVNPDRTARDLLAWASEEPPAEPSTARGFRSIDTPEPVPADDPAEPPIELPGEREFARLLEAGVPARTASHLVDGALRAMRGDSIPA